MTSRWKKLRDNAICELQVVGESNEDRAVVNENYAKYRCAEVIVLNIYDKNGKPIQRGVSIRDPKFVYHVGKSAKVNDANLSNEACHVGIHYFKTREAAEAYKSQPPQNGEHKEFHLNGQLWLSCHYKNDKKHGDYKEWFQNGKLYEQCCYVDGKREGFCEFWHRDGPRWGKWFFKDGVLCGGFQTWYCSGKLHETGVYENDILVGKYCCFYENGHLEFENHYNEYGKKHGDCKQWTQFGELCDYGRYENGQCVEQIV